jgi:chitin disaccharide deacetylase
LSAGERILIVNADDFGRTAAINSGVIRAHEHGIVTSASLMVRWPAARAAAEYCRGCPALAAGLHLDLEESIKRDGHWYVVYRRVPAGDVGLARREVRRQLEMFRGLVGRDPTHLDSHQHIHIKDPSLTGIFVELAAELGVPLRYHGIPYYGGFFGQTTDGEPLLENVAVDHLIEMVEGLPSGVTELGCHPGAGGDGWSIYDWERAIEVEALCDPRAPRAIERAGVELRSFAEVPSRVSA